MIEKVEDILPAGLYYIGDLSFLTNVNFPEEFEYQSGVFLTEEDDKFVNFITLDGNGVYEDGEDDVYYVDRGSIGCYPVVDEEEVETSDGQVIFFQDDFECGTSEDGTLYFGNVVIPTSFPQEDDGVEGSFGGEEN